ncbi:chromate transporter [Clostridium sediminicola]|uniref:chromate transporter n=1 Tax=Clostridium sediminicola TaxID=3114879 RepID=UPI0031F1CD69
MIYIKLFVTFFKIGLFSIGGGLATIPLLQEAISTNNWMSQQQFIDMIAISQSTPGPIGVNMSSYVGFTIGNGVGAIVATLGIITPSIIIIVIIAHYFSKFNEEPIVKAAFYGLRPAVTGLIAAAGFQIAKVSIFNYDKFRITGEILDFFEFKSLILFFGILFVANKWKKHPVFYIFVAAIIGIVIYS